MSDLCPERGDKSQRLGLKRFFFHMEYENDNRSVCNGKPPCVREINHREGEGVLFCAANRVM